MSSPRLLATSDLHCDRSANREVVRSLRSESDQDWLIVAGDVSDRVGDVEWALGTLRERFAKVIWVPGNHELWTTPKDEVQLRGEERYRHLVELCRRLDVLTPEDEYPVWRGRDEDLVIAPLFLLYDYSIGRAPHEDVPAALARAREAGVVGTDEVLLHFDGHASRQDWCHERVRYSEDRLDVIPAGLRTVLVNHFPLHPAPTKRLNYQDFALWCGTTLTQDWHLRYRAAVVVTGHLHIPLTDKIDGVRFEEVSLGYPREWQPRKNRRPVLRDVLVDTEPMYPLPS
ncbi:3',5'-cyclic AMP phosphodiesterase CpdA [Crossiella equi]|uniref:3',5'-cyclic AMP phosphodiesterase CpdA n=1 Tax=Crossiella equi TaxID=130796 RepID=A0ABS5ACC0_9PSEU|nr:metallophosphoesterase [Crossiella equi]MBP2473350.1 3',5'-cyclic AMP phosphodiesterase CpdA [Crossiella equi]